MESKTITNLNLDLTVDYGGSQVHSETLPFTNLANLGNQNFSFAPYTPAALGDYTFNMTASTGAQVDEVPGNNSVSFPFSLTDTVLARDNGVHAGGAGYAVSTTDAAIALTLYDFPVDVLS